MATFLRCCRALLVFRRSCKHILCCLRTDEAICLSPFGQTLCRWCYFSHCQSQSFCSVFLRKQLFHLFLLQSTFHSMTQLLGFFGESLLGHHSRSLNMRVSLPKWSNFWQLDQPGIFKSKLTPSKGRVVHKKQNCRKLKTNLENNIVRCLIYKLAHFVMEKPQKLRFSMVFV